jgi:sugar phosphate isomerase/epimerase
MRFAIFAASLPELTPAEAVAELRELGYDGIEWRVIDQAPSRDGRPGFWAGNRCTWPAASFVEDAPRIRALTEGAGLAMPNVGAYATCQDPAGVERAMRGAALLGAPQVRVNVPKYDGSPGYLKLRDRSLAEYREVAELARRHGVRALVELHHGSLLPSASAAAAFLQNFDPRYVGAIHDAGNMVHEGHEQYRMSLEVLGPYLAHVHLKNARWEQVGTRPDGSAEWRAGWTSLWKGVVDVAGLLRSLVDVGYDGWIAFEDFSTEQPIRERLRDNLAYVKRLLGEIEATAKALR